MCVIIVVIIAVIVLMSLSAIVLLLLTPSSLLSLLLSFSQHQVLFAVVAVNVLYVVLCYMLCRYHCQGRSQRQANALPKLWTGSSLKSIFSVHCSVC